MNRKSLKKRRQKANKLLRSLEGMTAEEAAAVMEDPSTQRLLHDAGFDAQASLKKRRAGGGDIGEVH